MGNCTQKHTGRANSVTSALEPCPKTPALPEAFQLRPVARRLLSKNWSSRKMKPCSQPGAVRGTEPGVGDSRIEEGQRGPRWSQLGGRR